MPVVTHKKTSPGPSQMLTPEDAGILKVLAYFDIFQYPLTKNEIKKFLGIPVSELLLEERLQQLVDNKNIFQHHEFYSLHNNVLLVHRRNKGNQRAERLLPKGLKIGRFLSRFPYVRAVCISGSLSKNFADEKADIDFFIITKADRLWLARTLMHLFKKFTFLTGHQHYFCMNYYIDESALLIEPQNIFTAVEVTTLLPVCGRETMKDFVSTNSWNQRYFPRHSAAEFKNADVPSSWIKKAGEGIFNNRLGDQLDQWLFRWTTRRWQKKNREGKRNKNGRTMNLDTGKHFARSNPGAFQEKVLSLYEQKLQELKLH